MKPPNLFERFFLTQKLQNLSPRITAFVDLVAGCKGRNLFRIFQIFFLRSFLKTSQNLFAPSKFCGAFRRISKSGRKDKHFYLPFPNFLEHFFIPFFIPNAQSTINQMVRNCIFYKTTNHYGIRLNVIIEYYI